MSASLSRVTVVGTRKKVDLAVPADAPIVEYSDRLARLVEQDEDDQLPPVWSLAPVGAGPMPVTSSLAAEGITDGAVLYLRDVGAGEEDEPVVQSVWEIVTGGAGDDRNARWDVRAWARATMVLGLGWLLASIGYLMAAGHWLGAGVTAMVTGVAVAVIARSIRPYPRVLPEPLRVVFGCAVIPCVALAAMLTLGRPELDGAHLTSAVVGAVIGSVVALIVVPDVLVGAFALLVGVTGVLVAVLLPLGATRDDVAGTVVVTAVLLLAATPRLAGALTAAGWLSMSATSVQPAADPERVTVQVRRAHRALVLLVSLLSAAAAVALPFLTGSGFALAVLVTATVTLLLRAGTFAYASEGLPPVVAAAVGLFALTGLLDRAEASASFLAPAMALVGFLAIVSSLPMLLWWSRPRREPGDRPLRFSALLTTAQVILPAVLLGLYGLYRTLWNLGAA